MLNGHVMATCRDAKGRISYVCVHCGRETINCVVGLDNERVAHSIPLDPCPEVVVEGAPWQDNSVGWYEVGGERTPVQDRVTGYELWCRRRDPYAF